MTAAASGELAPVRLNFEAHRDIWPALLAAIIFAALSVTAAVKSQGFLEGDDMTHYVMARHAFEQRDFMVSVWGRPVVTLLYALPAHYGKLPQDGKLPSRLVSLGLALLCGWVTWRIAIEQGMARPAIAVICLFAQPLFFLHSLSVLTELPFATLLILAFWAYQRRQFFWMTLIVSIMPACRPEGFGFVLLAAAALILHRRWWWLVMLPIPLAIWSGAGYEITHQYSIHWWQWLPRNWPYSGSSPYGHGALLAYVVRLPVLISPLIFPFLLIGFWRQFKAARGVFAPPASSPYVSSPYASSPNISAPGVSAPGEGAAAALGPSRARVSTHSVDVAAPPGALGRAGLSSRHMAICLLLVAVIPLTVLIVHSLLWRLGRMASSGELRYLVIASPMWALLTARGWEWTFEHFQFRAPYLTLGVAAILPAFANLHYKAVPFPVWGDDRMGERVATWYRHSPRIEAEYPRMMASLPSVYYSLDMSLSDKIRTASWGRGSVLAHENGVILVWDPTYGMSNSDSALCVPRGLPASAGWILYDKLVDPVEPGKYCLIYLSPRDKEGRPTKIGAAPVMP